MIFSEKRAADNTRPLNALVVGTVTSFTSSPVQGRSGVDWGCRTLGREDISRADRAKVTDGPDPPAIDDTRWSRLIDDTRWSSLIVDTRWSRLIVDTRWSRLIVDTRWSRLIVNTRWSRLTDDTRWSRLIDDTRCSRLIVDKGPDIKYVRHI